MNNILSALNRLPCSELTHDDWVRVGMALKAEGYDLSVWEDWSSRDAARYHPGECARRWNSFRGSSVPVTGATIVKLAQERGWSPFTGEDGCMDWDDVIEYDGDGSDSQADAASVRKPTEDLILYLQTLFDSDDHVGYVTNDAWQNDDGKWVPSKGVFDRTAGELIESLLRHPDDLGATVGDWKPEAGAWIRFNALDGEGVRNENVTSFRFALVESDAMPVDEQIAIYRRLELPIAALVSSAHKSVHAIVRVDANDQQEYRKRVSYDRAHINDIIVWNLRGHAVPLDQLVPKLVRRVRDQRLDAIIIDPIYKVITGDENSASDMAHFCNMFDRICNETGCSTIYCHHHSKGAQGAKRAMDRASGSGVFARDPDAQLDMIELELSDEVRNMIAETGATGWRLECSLREFQNFAPVEFWFEYPIHRLDSGASLRQMPAQGTAAAGRMKNRFSKTTEAAEEEFRNAFSVQSVNGSASVKDIMEYLDISDKTVYARLKKMNGEFTLKKGRIYHSDDPAITGVESV